jgi:hypothetical protein
MDMIKTLKPLNNENGMVLLVVLLIMAVLVLLGSTAVMTTTTDLKISSNYKTREQAFYNAEAGVEWVVAYLRSNTVTYPTTTGTPTTITVSCPTGFNFNTSVTINYVALNQYKFQMTGTGANNASKTIEAYIKKIPLYPQSADGAVAMYGGGPAVAFKVGAGGGYEVDGHDYPVPTNSSCNGSACNTTPSATLPAVPGLFTVMSPTLTGDYSAHLGGVPTQTLGSSRETEYNDFVNYVLTNNLYQSTLGTRADPRVTVIPNGTTLNGTGNGAGIIIIDDGGSLSVNGNFEYEGLVILRGTGRVFGCGTGNIFGTLITIGHTAKLIDLTGAINLFYSSSALANLSNIDELNSVQRTAWRDVF